MDGLCGSPFWNSNITWKTDVPDFTDCFKHTALIWIPSLYLWMSFPLEYHFLKRSKMKEIPLNKYNIGKLLTIMLLITHDLLKIFDYGMKPPIYIWSSVLKFSTSNLFLILTLANIKMGIRSSGILFGYSFVLVICQALSQICAFTSRNDVIFITEQVLNLGPSIIILLLNCFADSQPKYKLCQQDETYCPSQDASFLSKLFLCWFDNYVWQNYRKPLIDILWMVNPEQRITFLSEKFKVYWKTSQTQGEKKKQGIAKSILRMFWFDLTLLLIYRLMEMSCAVAFPLIFSLFLTSMGNNEPLWKTYLCSLLFLVNGFTQAIVSNKMYFILYEAQYKIKSILMSTIYKKAMKISSSMKKEYTTGDIINLLSVDTETITQSIGPGSYVCSTPIQIALSCYFVWNILGFSAFAVIVVVTILLPVINQLFKKTKQLQVIGMKNKDKRGKFIQELLAGIKVLKLYAWEPYFEKEVFKRRENELKTMTKYTELKAFTFFIFTCVPFFMSSATFATYVLSNKYNELNVETAFLTVSFISSLATTLKTTQRGLSGWVQAEVSIKRIDRFLNLEELNTDSITHDNTVKEAVVIEDGTFSWTDDATELPTLNNLNMKIEEGRIVSIVGPVGCGKSSLMSAILGEMNQMKGSVNIKGKVAYVSQQAWILNTTFKENITLGNPVEESLYQKALDVCALRTDLATMSNYDLTEIGERGINLSGGQKQRISLARAICYDADIYLLDDPFSAVDFHIANHIFQQVVGHNGLLKNKTRLLVTHSTTFLSQTDTIVVLKQGSISEIGGYQSLIEADGEFAKFMKTYSNEAKNERDSNTNYNTATKSPAEINTRVDKHNFEISPSKGLVNRENVKIGTVGFAIYKFYLSAIGIGFLCAFLTMYILYQVSSISSNVWLWIWSTGSLSTNTDDKYFYFKIYLILGLIEASTVLAGNVLLLRGLLKASSYLHNTLLSDILKWPMWLLHSTPVGRIISRLTDDIFVLDDVIGTSMVDLIILMGKLLSMCIVIVSTIPVTAVVMIQIPIFLYIIKKFYLPLYHQILRLDSINKSPLYSCFVETISGLSSVRAYRYQDRSISRVYEKIDRCSSITVSSIACLRCANTKLDILSGIVAFSISFFIIILRNDLQMGLIAFAMTYSIQMTKDFVILLLSLLRVETSTVAVERIKEYIDLPHEAPAQLPNDSKYVGWPDRGEIIFENYNLRYRDDLDLVLRDISINIKSGEKIGIVGRTGAGKTSLILGLFRLIEPAEGKIVIDGVDIGTIGLHLLRSHLTLIPQDPVLFIGTVRFNLDPTEKCSDESLWNVLEKAHLKDFISNLPEGLQHNIDEGGANLSYGQRQLICLARALLRKTKILILDEATASVDVETDELIQETIRNEFSDCTVVTIAHRLNTIIDYDRILVIDCGSVVEFDTPSNLMKSNESAFYRMTSESGLLANSQSK